MPIPICTKCRRVISSDDINVAKDVAYCRQCNISYRLSDLTFGKESDPDVDLRHPPQGAWYRTDGGGTVVGATNRSLGAALGMLFFALFWNGIVSVFLAVVISGTLHNLHLPVPVWFPAPKMNGGDMGPGMTLFMWLFLTPFLLIGLLLAITLISSLIGRTEVKIENLRGTIFTGVGVIGWKRRFDPSQVRDVRLDETRNTDSKNTITILIETREGKRLKLGSLLRDERRQFVFGVLRKTLVK